MQTKPHSEAPLQTCRCGSRVKSTGKNEWNQKLRAMKTGPTVPQNVRQLRSDLPITSLGHTEKGENHMTSKLVHTVSQAPDRTGNAHKHVLTSQSLWTKRGMSSFSFSQWNNPKSYSTTIWITGHYWIMYYKTPHIYTMEGSTAMKQQCTEPGGHWWTIRMLCSVNKVRQGP